MRFFIFKRHFKPKLYPKIGEPQAIWLFYWFFQAVCGIQLGAGR